MRGYVPALDGIRAVAIALVVCFHLTGFPPGGWLGVDLFFVLSGFLITSLLLQRWGTESVGVFYQRRALRLIPALVMLLLVMLAVDRSPFGALAGLGYFSNILMAGGHHLAFPASLTHLWSLAQEEQFYLVWPIVLYAAIRFGTKVALWIALAGVAASVAVAVTLFVGGASGYRLFYAPDTRAAPILVGCALALAMTMRSLSFRRVEIVALAAFPALLLVMDYTRLSVSGPPVLLFSLVAAVLIGRAIRADSAIAMVLSRGPLVFVGRISYSLYLWHYPIFVWLGVAAVGVGWLDGLAVGLAVAAACASYYLVELPFLRRKHALGRRRAAHMGTEDADLTELARA